MSQMLLFSTQRAKKIWASPFLLSAAAVVVAAIDDGHDP
jgi:hypothetical protein